MTRAPFLGLPVVCAAGVFLVGMASVARSVLGDLSLGTGVPDVAMIGLLVLGVLVLPGAALSIAAVGLALAGTLQLGRGQTGLTTAAAWLTLVGGGGIVVFTAGVRDLQVVGLAAVSLVGIIGLAVGGRRGRRAGRTGA